MAFHGTGVKSFSVFNASFRIVPNYLAKNNNLTDFSEEGGIFPGRFFHLYSCSRMDVSRKRDVLESVPVAVIILKPFA